MTRIMSLILISVFLILGIFGCEGGGGEGSPETSGGSADANAMQVLFIGNSYTSVNDLPGTFRQLSESGGYSVNAPMVGTGGQTLAEHANSQSTPNKIRSQQWEYVILQEQSQVPVFAALGLRNKETGQTFANEMNAASQQLDTIIRVQGAQTTFFVAWGRDEARAATMIEQSPMSSSQMQQYINNAYITVAEGIGGSVVVPVGSAWQRARKSGVPDDALWDVNDGYHPAFAGTYLAACVFYASLFGESPEGLEYIGELSENNARILQKIAWDQVQSGTLNF